MSLPSYATCLWLCLADVSCSTLSSIKKKKKKEINSPSSHIHQLVNGPWMANTAVYFHFTVRGTYFCK